jgi:hypothetical protein
MLSGGPGLCSAWVCGRGCSCGLNFPLCQAGSSWLSGHLAQGCGGRRHRGQEICEQPDSKDRATSLAHQPSSSSFPYVSGPQAVQPDVWNYEVVTLTWSVPCPLTSHDSALCPCVPWTLSTSAVLALLTLDLIPG